MKTLIALSLLIGFSSHAQSLSSDDHGASYEPTALHSDALQLANYLAEPAVQKCFAILTAKSGKVDSVRASGSILSLQSSEGELKHNMVVSRSEGKTTCTNFSSQ